MIKANEVRLGNWVRASLTGELMEINWLAVKHLTDGNIQAAGYDSRPVYEPIPLTPEILEAAGFTKGCPYGKYGWTINSDFFFEQDEAPFHPKEISSGQIFANEIKYLHQLQNLYFALTNSELEIKMPATIGN